MLRFFGPNVRSLAHFLADSVLMRMMWHRLGGAVRAAVSASPLAAAAAATTFVAPVALRAPSPAGERQHAHAGSKRARRGCVTVPRAAGGHGAPVCACGRPDASPLLHPHVSELGCVRALRACMRAVLCVYVCVYVCDCTEAFWSRKPMSSSAQNRLCLPCTFTAKNTDLPPSLCAVCVCACAARYANTHKRANGRMRDGLTTRRGGLGVETPIFCLTVTFLKTCRI